MLDFIVKPALKFAVKKMLPNVSNKDIDDVYSFVMNLNKQAKSPQDLITLAKKNGLTNEAINKVKEMALNSDLLSHYIAPQKAEELFNKYFGENK